MGKLIPIYFEGGRLTFSKQSVWSCPSATVEVPRGSELRFTCGLGNLLFVPSPEEPMQLWAHWPAEVLKAAEEGKQGFRIVK